MQIVEPERAVNGRTGRDAEHKAYDSFALVMIIGIGVPVESLQATQVERDFFPSTLREIEALGVPPVFMIRRHILAYDTQVGRGTVALEPKGKNRRLMHVCSNGEDVLCRSGCPGLRKGVVALERSVCEAEVHRCPVFVRALHRYDAGTEIRQQFIQMYQVRRVEPGELVMSVRYRSSKGRRSRRRSGIFLQVHRRFISTHIRLPAGCNDGVEIVFTFGHDRTRMPHIFLCRTGEVRDDRRQAGDVGSIGGLSVIERDGRIADRVKSEPTEQDRVLGTHFGRRYGEVDGRGNNLIIVQEGIGIEGVTDGVVGGQMDRGRVLTHVERRETGYTAVEHRVAVVLQLFLLVVVGISSATRAEVMHAVFV